VGHVVRMGKMRNAHKIIVGISEGKGSLGRRRRRLEGYITLDLRVRGWVNVNWMHLAHRDQGQALVNAVMSLRFHKIWE
jgi:hypothetical protein